MTTNPSGGADLCALRPVHNLTRRERHLFPLREYLRIALTRGMQILSLIFSTLRRVPPERVVPGQAATL